MSASAYVHWVKGGDVKEARKHGLTLLAVCGAKYVPHRRGVNSDLPSCAECEAIDGPLPRERSTRARRPGDESPHYVYRHYNDDGVLLYVGCTYDPRTRRAGHKQSSWWFPQRATTRLTVYPNRLHALRVEREVIGSEHPLWNVRHQDYTAWDVEQVRRAAQIAEAEEAPQHVIQRLRGLAS